MRFNLTHVICENCRKLVQSNDNSFVFFDERSFELHDAKISCPNCGQPGSALDLDNLLKNFVDILKDEDVSSLNNLRNQYANIGQLSNEQPIQMLLASTPEDSEASRRIKEILSFSRDDRNEIYVIIGLALSVISILISLKSSPEPKPVVNNYYMIVRQEIYKDTISKPKIKEKSSKISRNDPCPCGSGLKFKKCHGLLTR